MRLARIRTIAWFELRATIFRLGFLVTTFGLPLLLGGVTGTSALVQSELLASHAAASASIGVVDPAGIVTASSPDAERFADEASGLARLRAKRIDTLFVLAPDWSTSGRVRAITRAEVSALMRDDALASATLAGALRRSIGDRVATPEVVARLVDPIVLERAQLTPAGVEPESPDALAEALAAVMAPTLLGILLMSALLMASGYLVQTIAQDKETKIVEVLLASATADELLAGKLLGLGAAGLVQFGVWAALGGGAASTAFAFLPHAELAAPTAAVSYLPLFFVLGYAFLGSVMLSTGAFGSSAAESQKLTLGWVLLSVVPLLVLPTFLDAPHGPLARALTFVPFTAPIAIVVRLAIDPPGVPAWEIAAAAIELVLATVLALRIGARLFRVGLLSTGALPSLRAVWAQARGR